MMSEQESSKTNFPGSLGFVLDTSIHTEHGWVPVQWIGPGTKVLSRCEKTRQQAYRQVLRVFDPVESEMVCVGYKLDDGRKSSFLVTAASPVWVQGAGWVEAARLQVGQVIEICDPSGYGDEYRPAGEREANTLTGKRWNGIVRGVSRLDDTWSAYSFEVEEFHSFFVDHYGVWVHDITAASPKTTSEESEAAGFAAGTLIHTRNGAMPIEEVQEGDWVLSSLEPSGEQEFKQVVRTISVAESNVCLLSYYERDPDGQVGLLVVARDQRFFVRTAGPDSELPEAGWVPAQDLDFDYQIVLANGHSALVWGSWELRNTETEGVSWVNHGATPDVGTLVDLRNSQPNFDTETTQNSFARDRKGGFTKARTYKLEIKDRCGYYVGEPGIWARSA